MSACPRDKASKWARAPRRLLDRRRVHPEPGAIFDRPRFPVIKVYPHSFGAAQQHHLGEVTGPEPVFGALSGGGGVCLVDEGSGDVAEFAVAVWGIWVSRANASSGVQRRSPMMMPLACSMTAVVAIACFICSDKRAVVARGAPWLPRLPRHRGWCPGRATRENTSANGTLPNTRVPSCRTAPSGSADDDEHDPDRRRHARIVRNRHRRVAVGLAGVGWAGLGTSSGVTARTTPVASPEDDEAVCIRRRVGPTEDTASTPDTPNPTTGLQTWYDRDAEPAADVVAVVDDMCLFWEHRAGTSRGGAVKRHLGVPAGAWPNPRGRVLHAPEPGER